MNKTATISFSLINVIRVVFFFHPVVAWYCNVNKQDSVTRVADISSLKKRKDIDTLPRSKFVRDSSSSSYKRFQKQAVSKNGIQKMTTFFDIKNENWHDVEPVSNNVVYAYSYGTGKIVRSINKGKDWKLIKDAGNIYFEQVQFTDEKTGWICGENGSILFTNNGGKTWTNYSIKAKEGNLLLYGLLFTEEKVGYVSGALLHNNQLIGKLFFTKTAGLNWEEFQLPFNNTILHIEKSKSDIYFTGDNIIGSIKKDTVKILFRDSTNQTGQIRDVEILDDSIIIAVSFNGKYIMSKDYGKTWELKSITKNRLRSITDFNGVLLAAGDANKEFGALFYSKDLGQTWVIKHENHSDIHRLAVLKNNLWISGKNGVLHVFRHHKFFLIKQ